MNLALVPDLSTNTSYMIRPSSFENWLELLLTADSKDKERSLLYFGFQPLFDALVEKSVQGEARKTALELLERIVKFNTDFVSGYYAGGELPDVHTLEAWKPLPDGIPYRTKERNIGLYDGDGRDLGTPNHVQQFLLSLYDTAEKGVLPKPDYIVGCACGSSEIVMPMSRIFDVKLDFIRRSKRRNDEKPLVIAEHVAHIHRRAKAKIVYVVEDWVCTGQSIHAVMEKVSSFEPARVIGMSMARNSSDPLTSKLKIIHSFKGKHGAYAYEKVQTKTQD